MSDYPALHIIDTKMEMHDMRGNLQTRCGHRNKMMLKYNDEYSVVRVDGYQWAWYSGTKENCKRMLHHWSGRRWAKYNKEIPF
jgi:hypothetical protein